MQLFHKQFHGMFTPSEVLCLVVPPKAFPAGVVFIGDPAYTVCGQ